MLMEQISQQARDGRVELSYLETLIPEVVKGYQNQISHLKKQYDEVAGAYFALQQVKNDLQDKLDALIKDYQPTIDKLQFEISFLKEEVGKANNLVTEKQTKINELIAKVTDYEKIKSEMFTAKQEAEHLTKEMKKLGKKALSWDCLTGVLDDLNKGSLKLK